jgi:polyhydroxybutyrate depolymerase
MRTMKIRKILIGTAVVIVGVPLVLILVAIVLISVFDRTNGTIVSSGETREYLLHVPDSYDPAEPSALVISLHALATWPAQQKNLSRWNRLADEDGFIVVYPSGSGFPRMWHTIAPGAGLDRDVRFISELIDTLQSTYNIDPARIYATGMSNGGGMAFVLSCTLSDRIAAVGLVATAQALPPSWCTDMRPIPVIAFHGGADPLVPYEGGPFGDPFNPVKTVFPAVRDWVARWAQRNRCSASPVESAVAPDVIRIDYSGCSEGAPVVLYTIQGAGHIWPGGKPLPEWRVGRNSDSVDATSRMWAFFGEHRLGEAETAAQPPDGV